MRPISLRLEGFTSFRKITEVDFKGLDIFAIVGPTGAGKTSLIDAITYALYGCTARVSEKNISDLIHLGSQQASVLFEFRSGNKNYRIVRSIKKTKKHRNQTLSKENRAVHGGRSVSRGVGEKNYPRGQER